ncbi:MAG: lysozyme inhibitor LprI family protein [Pseudomonadota bacterium]
MQVKNILIAFFLAAACSAVPPNALQAQELNCQNAVTQTEMTNCARMDWEAADKELNAAWEEALVLAEDEDAFRDSSSGDNRPGYVETLRDAQGAWISFRDLECEYRGFQARGGSMEPMLVNQCLAELTRNRTTQLRNIIQEMGMQ